jgi:hypothetical protein
MSSYAHAYSSLAPLQQQSVEKCLERWRREMLPQAQRIIINLKDLEHFLPPENMSLILLALIDLTEPTISLSDVYRSICRENVCKGDSLRCESPLSVCRAVEEEVFTLWLFEKYRSIFQIENNARAFLRQTLAGTPLSATEGSFRMSEYIAWATWTPKGSSEAPLEIAGSALYIRSALGLDPEQRFSKEPLLLLTYMPPSDLFRPTVADAELGYQFEPPPLDFESHGLTRPLSDTLPRRPEAIHHPVEFSTLLTARKVAP